MEDKNFNKQQKVIKADPVTVDSFYQQNVAELGLKLIAGKKGLHRIIKEPTVNRPGLVLAGFTKFFSFKRVQVIGSAETNFLKSLPPDQRETNCRRLFDFRMPCVVFSRNLNPEPKFLAVAEERRIPIFKCPMPTVKFINSATLALESLFAPRGSEMGSMVDIHGIGVIIKGESGIGKSECVLALLERGYSLVADDVTKLTLIDGKEVLGSSSELTRDHMEVRGIGIINVAAMFGVKAFREKKRVELVVSLKDWSQVEDIDRLGIDEDYYEIFNVKIPHITIPVRPGRDLARLVEVAAFQTKLRLLGHNAAQELEQRILAKIKSGSHVIVK